LTATPAIANSSAVLFGVYDAADWQLSLNAIKTGTYDALNQSFGKPMSLTGPQLAWANGSNADGTPKYNRLYTPRLDADRAAGRVSMLTWSSMNMANKADQAFNNEAILAGKHDAFLTQFGKDAGAYGHPFLLRFDWEMNGTWFLWSEMNTAGVAINGNVIGDYVAMWRHVHAIVAPLAPNISWCWVANPISAKPSFPLSHWYPGDDVVDYVGLDVYNWAAAANDPWCSFSECIEGRAAGWPLNSMSAVLSVAPGKPWVLGEVGCNDTALAGDTAATAGNKPAWITDMLTVLPQRYPFIKAFCWFNVNYPATTGVSTNWRLDTPSGAAQAFGAAVQANPAYLAGGGFPLPADSAVITPYSLASTPDKDAQIASANAAVATAQQQLTAAQAQAQTNANNLANAQQQLNAAQASLAQTQQTVASLQAQVTQANAATQAQAAQVATLQASLAATQHDRDAARADAAAGRSAFNGLNGWASATPA
jgi:hypothetical protein